MANRYNEVSGPLGIRVHIGVSSAQNVNAVDNCNGCVDCESNIWLASSTSTATSEMGREATPGCGGEISFLHPDGCTPARLSDDLHASVSTNELVCTSVQATKSSEQISCGVASGTSPTAVVKHFDSEAALEKTIINQLTAEKCRKAEEIQEVIVTAGRLTSSLNGKQPSAELNIVRPTRGNVYREISMLAKGGCHGESEDYTLHLEDPESTTASSSRRSSGLSRVDGATQCLEELVGHVEEELAEQHLRFERLQSFCEVVADVDDEFVSFGCTLEVPASWNSNAGVEAWRQYWDTAPADLPQDGRTSLTRASKLHCTPCNSGGFVVDPSDTGEHGLDVFGEKAVAENLHLLRESTEKLIKPAGMTTTHDASPPFKGVYDTLTLAMGTAGSSVTALEEFSTPAAVPNCIGCGRSMSCSRCYPRTVVSILLQRHNRISQPLANTGTNSGILHACGADSVKREQLLVDEGDDRKIGCFLSGGACGGCASNIYCLTCLEHMQEQTAGLRALTEGDLQATEGRGLNEHRQGVEIASILALTATLPHPLFTNGLSGGRQGRLQVDIRPQRMPEAGHCARTAPALISAEAGTRLGCKLIGIREMAERYTLRTRDNCAAITNKKYGTLSCINSTCAIRGLGNAREASLSDSGETDQKASLPSLSGCVHSLRLEITHDTTGNTCPAAVCGIKHIQWAEGEFEKQKYMTSLYSSLHPLKRKALRWEGSQGLRPPHRFHVTGIPGTDSSAETIESTNFTNGEDVSRLVYDRTCVLEVTACAEHRESSTINYVKACGGEHASSKVRPRQKVLTQRGLKRKNVIDFPCSVRDIQSWEQAGSSVKCCSANSCGHALRGSEDRAAYFFTQGQCSYGGCSREKSRRVSLSLSEKQDKPYREPCCAAAHFGLVRQQRVDSAVLMQRSGHVHAYTTAKAAESRSGLNDQVPPSGVVDSINSFQGPRSHQPHSVAPRKRTVTLSSAAAYQQIEVRTRVSSSPCRVGAEFRDKLRWQQDTRAVQMCSRCVTRTSSSSLRFSPYVLEGEQLSRGFDEKPGRTAVDFDNPAVLLGSRARLRGASGVCDDDGELAGGPISLQEQNGANVTHVCGVMLSPPDAQEERREEENKHAGGDDHWALTRGAGRTSQTEKWIEWDDAETVNSALFCKQQFSQSAWNTSLSSPVQIRSELTCAMQCERAHWKHKHSFQHPTSVCAPDCDTPAAATLKHMGSLWKGENAERKEENTQWNRTFDSLAVATWSKNINLDSRCTAKLPSLLYSRSSATTSVHDEMTYGNLSKREADLMMHDWEVRQLGCVAPGSKFIRGSSTCTPAEGQSTTIALSERTSETVSYCACDGRESPVRHKQGDPTSTPQGRERESHITKNDAQHPQAIGAAHRHSLEVSSSVLPASTARQGEHSTCSWSARLTTATVSIGSTISTTSEESSYDHSSGSTPLGCSLGEKSEIGVSDSAPQAATPVAWTAGRCSSHTAALEHAGSSSGTPVVGAWRPLSPHIPCVTRRYGGEHSAWKRGPLTARSAPGWGVDGSGKRCRIGHRVSQQETQETEKQARFDEQVTNSWISWQEETALQLCRPAAGAVSWHPRLFKVSDTVSAGVPLSRAKTLGADKPAALLASIGIPPFSSTSCYSDDLAVSVEAVQTDKGNALYSAASQKHYAAEPAEDWKEFSTSECFRTTTTVSPHSSRQPRSKKRNSKAHRGDNTDNEGNKPTATEEPRDTDMSDYEKGRGERAEVQEPGQFLTKEETVTSSAALDALQSPHSMETIGQLAPIGENVTGASCPQTFLEFGTSDNDFNGVKASGVADAGTSPSWGNVVMERGESASGAGFSSDMASCTADASAGGTASSGASLYEHRGVRGESRRHTLPEKGVQVKAGEARSTRMGCRTREKSVSTSEGTRKSWRTGADGKVLYDACGHKISGVWYDNGRRLWRVVFTQGERRRTKGFSLKQYGFEQARNLAVQCKLAIEARKALCEEETA